VPLLVDAAESGLLIQAARGIQVALRPKRDLRVAGLPREPDAFVDEPSADAQSARLRLDQQQPEFGDLFRFLDEEDGAETDDDWANDDEPELVADAEPGAATLA